MLEDSWRALAAGERDNNLLVVDLGAERHRCGTPTDCYYDHGTPWCLVCWDGNTPAPWQDLIDRLGVWQIDMLVRQAARAYHETGRSYLVNRLPLRQPAKRAERCCGCSAKPHRDVSGGCAAPPERLNLAHHT